MGNYTITSGIIHGPQKVVLYGPEGIGKSTFFSKFPDPVFIDTEGGSAKLNIKRLPAPTSWAMLLDEADAVRRGSVPCKTLVLDTADWAERLCLRAVCAAHKWSSIEDAGYGKGYTYNRDEFATLLDLLEEIKATGINIGIAAHAQITKFEQPDEMGQYDRWSMKTSKQVAPLLREWADMLLFANYKTFVVKDGDGKNAKGKAQGGQRVMYTTHHPCWDAKNRDGLPEECPFDFSAIANVIPAGNTIQTQATAQKNVQPAPRSVDTAPPIEQKAPVQTAAAESETVQSDVPAALLALMKANDISPAMIQQAVTLREIYPEGMQIKDYDKTILDNLVAKWPQWLQFIKANCDLPF